MTTCTEAHALVRSVRSGVLALCLAVTAACASGPSIRSDYDRSANFADFQTFSYAAELGTDRAGYSTLVTEHFKSAITREMQARGYQLVDTNPDLIVNFYTSVRHETDVRSTPTPTVGVGYYGYRYGLYTGWPAYSNDVTTVNYAVGTANVDVVDADERRLVWEGVAEGRLTDEMMQNPRPAIDSVITEVFARYPARAGAPPSLPAD